MHATIQTTPTKQLNPDDLSLAFTTRFDSPVRYYDDGFGPLWIMRDSMGIMGIVRAQTWEDAYSIAEDEFFPECELTMEEIHNEYDFRRTHERITDEAGKTTGWKTIETPEEDAWSENELWQEAYGFRPNGPNERDTIKHGLYAKDLNGEALDPLTTELAEHLELKIIINFSA
jgi:hypothetical protein